MLKNKKAIYILLPVVIIIWGIIFYEIFSPPGGRGVTEFTNTAMPEQSVSRQVVVDTFSITANYRDPFLGKIFSEEPNTIKKLPEKVEKVEKKPIQPIKWPTISYGGMIRNQQTNKLVAMININGKDYLMNEGDLVSEVGILKVYPDSVRISYSGEQRTVLK